jgi:hypothetical protein
MAAVTFLSDSEARSYETVEGDKDCNELLQELNHASGRRWLIERRTFYRSRGLFRHAEEIKTYTLYLDCHGEYQVMNLVTPNGGSVFSYGNREAVMNYMLGHLAGLQEPRP